MDALSGRMHRAILQAMLCAYVQRGHQAMSDLTPAQQQAASAIKYPTREEALSTLSAEELDAKIAELSDYRTRETIAELATSQPLSYASIVAFGVLAESLGLPVALETHAMKVYRDVSRKEREDMVAQDLVYKMYSQRRQAAIDAATEPAAVVEA